jgi:hypothetical protein
MKRQYSFPEFSHGGAQHRSSRTFVQRRVYKVLISLCLRATFTFMNQRPIRENMRTLFILTALWFFSTSHAWGESLHASQEDDICCNTVKVPMGTYLMGGSMMNAVAETMIPSEKILRRHNTWRFQE